MNHETQPNKILPRIFDNREVGHRLTICWVSLALVVIALFEPSSLRYQVVASAGPIGQYFCYALGVMSIIGIVDVFANDILDDGYTLALAREGRMYAYMLLAAMNLSLVSVTVQQGLWSWTDAVNVVVAAGSVWVAVIDTYHRYIKRRLT